MIEGTASHATSPSPDPERLRAAPPRPASRQPPPAPAGPPADFAAGDPPRLFAGLAPHPGNWRARLPRPAVLPHFPMTLHRGGYPDGA